MRQDTGLSFSQNASANIALSHVERAERHLIPWKVPIPNAGCCTMSYHDIQGYTIPPSQFSNGMKCWLHLWETLLRLHLWEILLNEALFQWFFDENKSWHAMSVCSVPEREGNASWPSFWQLRKPDELIEALQRTSKLLESAGQSDSHNGLESINFNCFMSTSATWGFPQKQLVAWISDFYASPGHHPIITAPW